MINGIVRPPRANYKESQLGIFIFIQEPNILFTTKSVIIEKIRQLSTKKKTYNLFYSNLKIIMNGSFYICMETRHLNYSLFHCSNICRETFL
jgi:hypothetical protein